MKICGKCNLEKDDCFYERDRRQCKECRNKYKKTHGKQYYQNNKEKILENKKEYYQNNKEAKKEYNKEYNKNNKDELKEKKTKYRENNKEAIKENRRKYYQDNKSKFLEVAKEYYQNNKEDIKETHKEYYQNNKDKYLETVKEYYKNNKEKILIQKNKYEKKRLENDLNFKLKRGITSSIRSVLKLRRSSKHGESCLKYLDYNIEELKIHIEKQFEPWMNWKNWGSYKLNKWNDNDQSTWRWNIDHIIPHSTFKYKSMEEQSFKDCWELSNLRPYSAKQNIIDGNRR